MVKTTYPVWRARNLPFGKGVLSLAQRGETGLEMYSRVMMHGRELLEPVERFEGHTDVVKEYVWRRAGGVGAGSYFYSYSQKDVVFTHCFVGGSEFQLITWSKDRTLRFWPIDKEIMQVCHTTPHFSRPY